MDKCRCQKQSRTSDCATEVVAEVGSIELGFINLSEQEEDLVYKMYSLVGDRWNIIAGRIPGRKPEEIERFWMMRHEEGFAQKRLRSAS